MINASALLKDLQQELTRTVADIGSHVAADGEVRGGLETEWKHAFDAHRTGRTFEAWLEDRLTQVGVGWLLAFVFVRFCEDNLLIAEPMIGGPGDRGAAARVSQQRYFAEHPHDSDREYLHRVFRHAAELPGLSGLLAEGESPLWLVDPPADACTRMLSLFRAADDERGELLHDFTDQGLDTRFLGDLYQDLSAQARADYALLQTPDFVEEFILDRTLTPAIEAFGLSRTTLIDPTCGSGHFLLGAFDRLWKDWRAAEPATSERELVQRALTAVTGVDLNPFAAAIARFRLLVAALKACDINNLRDAPDFKIDVAVGDSLLWGARSGQLAGMEAAATASDRQFLYRTEHATDLQRVFGKQYAAVVGNPPYIVCRDAVLSQQYRDRFGSCHRQYSLGVPFTERFFELALAPDHLGMPAGFVGMITSNAFMKREFGKRLIEKYIPTWDLTHVIDTSGAYIPGHGTPTVILLGRHRRPVAPTIRTVMGIRGEPAVPNDPREGLVWSAILAQIDEAGSESDFITSDDTDRERFRTHPWSIGGGGSADLKAKIEAKSTRMKSQIDSIGSLVYTRSDDAYLAPAGTHVRFGIDCRYTRPMIEGGSVRDWATSTSVEALFPYDPDLQAHAEPAVIRRLWPFYQHLIARREITGSQLEIGLTWFEYNRFLRDRFRSDLLIAFSNISTHNHFVLNRGETVFNAHAPVIRLPDGASVDDHLALLGPLNSSVACFWMKQVCFDKGLAGAGNMGKTEEWRKDFEFDGTKLQQLPLPVGEAPLELARILDALGCELSAQQPAAVCRESSPTVERLRAAGVVAERLFSEMVAWQEELDWACLRLYGITDRALVVPTGEAPPPVHPGQRAFEIVLARKASMGDLPTTWFARNQSDPITEPPSEWPTWYQSLVEQRIDLIETDRDVGLIERPEHKRRWVRDPWTKLETAALRSWLLDRLEVRTNWFDGVGDAERAVCRSIAQLADRVARDDEFMSVARIWKGTVEVDPTSIVTELVADELVPAQSAARYKASGLVKRRQWERTWDLQRLVDRGEALPDGLARVPTPPKYAPTDFQRASFWRLRGKLDNPKERLISVVGAEREGDRTTVLAWAGFDHAQLAQAIGTLLVEREQSDGWDADRRWPLVVAMAEQLPWLDQWHSEIDPRWGASPAQLYRGIAEQHALAGGRTLADVAGWQPSTPTRGRMKTATKDSTS